MSVPLHQASGSFDPGILPRHLAEAVWRGSDLGGSASRAIASGFAELDAQLPGGGWPTHALTELLTPQSALCEWRLLGPSIGAMLQDGGRIYLIAPPKQPHAAGLVQLGVAPDQIVWIEASTPVDCLWVTEQIVKSDPAGAVLSWLPQARPEQIRRLQVHALACDAPVFLFRPVTTLRDSSPAPLRIATAPAAGWDLEVQIPKRKGSSFDGSLYLSAMPSNLGDVIPPRLKILPAASTVFSREEAADARALGRIPTRPAAGVPQSH